jgi:hypothetical protein
MIRSWDGWISGLALDEPGVNTAQRDKLPGVEPFRTVRQSSQTYSSVGGLVILSRGGRRVHETIVFLAEFQAKP